MRERFHQVPPEHKLTTRDRIVVGIIIAAAALLIIWAFFQ